MRCSIDPPMIYRALSEIPLALESNHQPFFLQRELSPSPLRETNLEMGPAGRSRALASSFVPYAQKTR